MESTQTIDENLYSRQLYVLGHKAMPWELIFIGTISAIVIFVSGALYFRKKERIFVDVA